MERNVFLGGYMLSENQIKRLLKQCETVDDTYGYDVPSELEEEQARNQGWCQALRLVLEINGVSIIRDTSLD